MDNTATNPISNITQPIQQGVQEVKVNKIKAFVQKNLTKIIFGLLGLVVVIELVLGARALLSPSKPRIDRVNALIASMTDPKLVLSSNLETVGVGQNIDVAVRVVTGGKSTDSTDLVLKFDPNFLEASSSSIKLGQIYSEFPVADVDPKSSLVAISGITLPGRQGFSGIGTLATITFKAKQAGKTSLTIDYQKDATADSNVVESGTAKDILGEVVNLEITIGGNSESRKVSTDNCPGFTQYCLTQAGKTGRQFCKQGVRKNNSCVFDPNLTVSCDVCKVTE